MESQLRQDMISAGMVRLTRKDVFKGEDPVIYMALEDIAYITRTSEGETKVVSKAKFAIQVEETGKEVARAMARSRAMMGGY